MSRDECSPSMRKLAGHKRAAGHKLRAVKIAAPQGGRGCGSRSGPAGSSLKNAGACLRRPMPHPAVAGCSTCAANARNSLKFQTARANSDGSPAFYGVKLFCSKRGVFRGRFVSSSASLQASFRRMWASFAAIRRAPAAASSQPSGTIDPTRPTATGNLACAPHSLQEPS